MDLKKPVYYCNHCKKITHKPDDQLYVESTNARGFCTEDCIENYYAHLIEYFETTEVELRKKLDLSKEKTEKILENEEIIEETFSNPSELWVQTNEVNESIYTFISISKKQEDPSFVIINCFIFNSIPSFIINGTSTYDERLVNEFRIGNKIEDPSTILKSHKEATEETGIDEETLINLERKKSSFLADILSTRKESDITFENFHLYEDFFQGTLEEADEIYEFSDDEGDSLYCYIKACDQNGVSFYYFVICMKYSSDWESSTEVLLPIVSFPSVDGDIYKRYTVGELITGAQKN